MRMRFPLIAVPLCALAVCDDVQRYSTVPASFPPIFLAHTDRRVILYFFDISTPSFIIFYVAKLSVGNLVSLN